MIAPRPADTEARALETLARIVVEDAESRCRRAEDRALNESRRLVGEAEDQIADLDRAARELGRTRGQAADAAQEAAAIHEVAALETSAFERLRERFERRVLMALRELPKDETRYAAALRAWARAGADVLEGPVEVFTAKRDRAEVYAALLATSARDFHVRVEPRVHVGFVARDLEGRVLFDARPEALVAARSDALSALLERAVAEAPRLQPTQPVPPEQVEVGKARE